MISASLQKKTDTELSVPVDPFRDLIHARFREVGVYVCSVSLAHGVPIVSPSPANIQQVMCASACLVNTCLNFKETYQEVIKVGSSPLQVE